MIIDGNKLAEDIKSELKREAAGLAPASLAVISVGDDQVSAKYVAKKRKFAEDIGVGFDLFEFDGTISEEDLVEEIGRIARREEVAGILVQLPLPAGLDQERVLSAIPADKDVDALTGEAVVPSPVIRAIGEILGRHGVSLEGKRAAVIGQGKLVGRPAAVWLASEGVDVEIVTEETKGLALIVASADLIVSGAGHPGLIEPEMVKEGVVLIDAATAESGGKLVGDADPACAAKCALFTPVPGGVGPVTVACLFKNLLELAKRR